MLMVACSVVTTILVSTHNHYQWHHLLLVELDQADILASTVEVRNAGSPQMLSVLVVCCVM